MGKEIVITNFIALPNSDASQIGEKISGVRLFKKNEMKKRLSEMNGEAGNFTVLECEIERKNCKYSNCGMIVTKSVSATIKKRHTVADFLKLA